MARQNIPGKPRESKQNLDLLKHYFSAMKKTLSTSKEVQILKSLQILTNTKISHYFKSFLSFLTKFCILLPLV